MKQPVLEKGRKKSSSSSSNFFKKREAFAKDIQKIKLQKDGIPNKRDKLSQLNAFLDKNGVLGVAIHLAS